MASLEEYYELVDDIYDEEEFMDEVRRRKEEEFNGLFTEEIVARLIAAEDGRSEASIEKDISELEAGDSATVLGEVIDLGELRTFDSGGNKGRVRNIRIDDGTGSVKVTLWNEETERVGTEINLGSKIKVINGYVQDRGYGLQISGGRWGEIKVEGTKD